MRLIYAFIIILVFYSLLVFLDKNFISTESRMVDFLAKDYPSSVVQSYVESHKKWWWVSYAVIPFVIGIKILFVSFCLNFIKIIEIERADKIRFSDIVFVVILSATVFIIAGFYKFINFYVVDTDYTLEDLQTYYPISLLNIKEYISTEKWLMYPLQLANLFEVFYWIILILSIRELLENKISYTRSLGYVVVTYGVGLLFWVGIICFIIINTQY